MRYLVILEKAENNYSAYAPDIPGCISTGKTVEETKTNMVEALTLHLDGLYSDGDPIPKALSEACYLEFDWTPTLPEPCENKDPLAGLD